MAFAFAGGTLATEHLATESTEPIAICKLPNDHLLNIIRKHCKNVRAVLPKPVAKLVLGDCWLVCNFPVLIAPYVQEALVRGLWSECQYELENVYKRCEQVRYQDLAQTRFSAAWLEVYNQRLAELECTDDYWWGELDWLDFQR